MQRSIQLNIITFAKKAGVSVATVSRAMNPKTAHMVKEKTRSEILDLAAKLNFTPHPGARALRKSSAAPIAVLLRRKQDILLSEYYSRLLNGIIHTATAKGTAVHTIIFEADSSDFNDQLNAVALGCAGVIYLSDPPSMRALYGLERLHMPFVIVAGSLPVELDSDEVSIPVFEANDFAGSRLATEHLIALGHRNIAILSGPLGQRDAKKRRDGFETAMTDHELVVRSDWCLEAGFAFESGLAKADQIAALLPEVTAVVCGNDELAMGLIRGLSTKGIQCPDDVSVTGYDDALWAGRHAPSVTTVRQPWLKMAESAVQMVVDLRQEGMAERKSRSVLIEPELVVRETTSSPTAAK